MTTAEVSVRLSQIEAELARGIESLVLLRSPAETCPTCFLSASELLQDLPVAEVPLTDLSRICQRLQQLSAKVATASSLLDSAAQLQFGNILYQGLLQGGYRRDGALDAYGGGTLHIEG
jgi:hypothetical protein